MSRCRSAEVHLPPLHIDHMAGDCEDGANRHVAGYDWIRNRVQPPVLQMDVCAANLPESERIPIPPLSTRGKGGGCVVPCLRERGSEKHRARLHVGQADVSAALLQNPSRVQKDAGVFNRGGQALCITRHTRQIPSGSLCGRNGMQRLTSTPGMRSQHRALPTAGISLSRRDRTRFGAIPFIISDIYTYIHIYVSINYYSLYYTIIPFCPCVISSSSALDSTPRLSESSTCQTSRTQAFHAFSFSVYPPLYPPAAPHPLPPIPAPRTSPLGETDTKAAEVIAHSGSGGEGSAGHM